MAFPDAQQSSYWYPPFYHSCSHCDCSDYDGPRCSECFFPSPSPPSLSYYHNSSHSHSNSYAGIVAAIGVIATVFLFLPFFIIAYKWCLGSRRQHLQTGEAAHHDNAWRITVNGGLEESVIRSIATCKYRRGDGFVDGTDCAICLGEFKEDESLRLLPKCSHAFHIHCIDTWLKSQSNCPLCRAIVIAMPPPSVVQQEEAPAAAPSQQTGNGPSAATAGGGEGQSSR